MIFRRGSGWRLRDIASRVLKSDTNSGRRDTRGDWTPLPYPLTTVPPRPSELPGLKLLHSIVNEAAEETNRGIEGELQGINAEIRAIMDKARRRYERKYEAAEASVRRWAMMRQSLEVGSFRRFAELFGRLKAVETEGSFSDATVSYVREFAAAYGADAETRTGIASAAHQIEAVQHNEELERFIRFSIGERGVFLQHVFRGMKLLTAVDRAKEQLAKARMMDQKVRAAERRLTALQRRADELHEVAVALDRLFALSLGRLEAVIDEAGTDFASFTRDEKQSVKLAYHFAEVLLVILKAPLVENNRLSRKSHAAVEQARAFLEAAEAM